jgi:ferredoxin--NADP+ reductase
VCGGSAVDIEDGRNAIMAYVITDACIKDGLCIESCPTECIHPTKEEAQFETVTQMYINQEECLDCGACQAACDSNAIFPGDQVPEGKEDSAEKNSAYFAQLTA